MPYTPEQLMLLSYLNCSFSSISFVCCIIILIIRIYRPKVFGNTMGVILMSLVPPNLLRALSRMFGRTFFDSNPKGVFCHGQAFLIDYTSHVIANLSVVIAFTMTYVVYFARSTTTIDRYLSIAITIAYLAAIPQNILLVTYKPDGISTVVGDGDIYCWIDKKFSLYRIYLDYSLTWTDFVLSIIAYAMTFARVYQINRELTRLTSNMPKNTEQKRKSIKAALARRMMLYVFAFILIWLPSTLNRMVQFGTGESIFVLGILHAIFNASSGTIDLLIFLYLSFGEIFDRNAKNESVGRLTDTPLNQSKNTSNSRESREFKKTAEDIENSPTLYNVEHV